LCAKIRAKEDLLVGKVFINLCDPWMKRGSWEKMEVELGKILYYERR
jgi:hypothetical protein